MLGPDNVKEDVDIKSSYYYHRHKQHSIRQCGSNIAASVLEQYTHTRDCVHVLGVYYSAT